MKKLILLFTALMSLVSVDARLVNEQEAKMKAQQFFDNANQSNTNRKTAPRKAPELVLANNREELYIFNDNANGGYVVISGDDRLPDVLAYSYDGLYDDNDIPCNMKAWINDYAEQVTYLQTNPQAKVRKRNVTERQNISPLLTCWFNQFSPYNNKCPEVDGNRCPTGCVATAMAQIMYYHQWPKQTTCVIPGYTTYTNEIAIPEQPITTIDWDNIRSDYRETYSSEQADAVSTLMLLCGTAVTMDYTPSASGASDYQTAVALRKYFDYDELLDVVNRGTDADGWEDMIYEELKGSRPVYYSGYKGNENGHAFVMDGYEDGYFHVNWGWGGAYSYVLMTDVEGWNEHQSAIVGIRPVNPGNPSEYAVLDNGKMILYYDEEMAHRSGTVIPHRSDRANYATEITECVIDPSMANLKQTSLSGFFAGLNQLKSIVGIENLNTEKVTNMAGMFYECSNLTSLDLNNFKTDNVTNMAWMFSGCSNLSSLDLSNFKTDKVTEMTGMFDGCSSLTSLDLSSFNTDNVWDMQTMFAGCSSLTSLNLSNFKTDKVWAMYRMFELCRSLTSLDLSSFNTENVMHMSYMFTGCNSLTSLGLSSFNTENVIRMDYMFAGCSSLTNLDVSSFNTGNVTNMCGMFAGCSSLTSLDLSSFNTSNVTDMSRMFASSSLTNLDLSGLNTEKVTNMSYMFANFGLTSLDLSGLNTENVTDMSYMFSKSSLTSLDLSGFNTGNVKDMTGMFWNCSSLMSLDVSNFNIGNVTSMYIMFSGCSSLTSLDLSNFNADNATDMGQMFNGCSSLTSIDLSSFKTDNVTNMFSMFGWCSSLTSLDLSSFKTDNVTVMGEMFRGCSNLTSLDLTSFNTKNVTSMNGMFIGCSSLTSLDLSSFNADNATDMGQMFSACSNLTSLDLSSFNTENVIRMDGMFSNCSSIKSIFVGNEWKTDNVTDSRGMFYACPKLVGGSGTRYDSNHTDHTYAHIDGGESNPGYFRDKNLPAPAEPYTVMSNNNTVVTFYCDNQMESRGGVEDYEQQWRSYAGDITDVVFDESFANCTTLTSTAFWFCECKNLKSITGIDNLKTDNVKNMEAMFKNCSNLTSLDLSNFNTENVTRMFQMFVGCSSLTNLNLSNFNTGNVTDMTDMFHGCSGLTSLDLSSFNTGRVSNMWAMFSSCYNLKYIFVGNEWTTACVKLGDEMFSSCSKLVGGSGTRYSPNHIDYTYAHIDGGDSNPGYFRDKNLPPAYTVLSNNNTVVTFYYDDQMESRGGKDVLDRQWRSYVDDITDVVFDESLANCTTLTSTASWFSECGNLRNITGIDNLKTVINMSFMFNGCSRLTSLDLSNFNTGNATNMCYMFNGCSSLTSLDLSNFNTSNVANMSHMFANCSGLTSLNLGNFNTDNATNMSNMFNGCSSLTSLDLSSFNTGNATDMSNMFNGCSNLTSLNLGNFNTGNATDMSNMFNGCSGLTSLDLSGFNTENVTNMNRMFANCASLTSLDVSGFNTENVTNMGSMFSFCAYLTSLDLSSFKTENVTNMGSMFSGCFNLKSIYIGNEWTTENVTYGTEMFSGCIKIVGGSGTRYDNSHTDYTYAHIDGGDSNPGYFRDKNLPDPPEPYTVLSDNNTILTFYYDNQMESRGGRYIYDRQWRGYAGDIINVVFDESFAGFTRLTSTASWFNGCTKLEIITGINNLRTDNVTDMSYMFYYCSGLTNLDLSSFNTGNVTSMSLMFSSCSNLTNLDLSSFNTGNVTSMYGMFWSCSNLTSLDLSSFNTGCVTDMSYMFYDCSGLTNLDLSSFNTGNVTSMSFMFSGCSNLTSLDLSSFNTGNVTSMYGVFRSCSNLTSLDLNGFVTDNVTDMGSMFEGCSNLTSLDLSSFNTRNVTNMSTMFYNCSTLTSLDLSSFNTGSVTSMGWMFCGCSCLKFIFVGNEWTTDNVKTGTGLFSSCTMLVGGSGTKYDSNHTDYTYAHLDGGASNPGYLSDKASPFSCTLTYMVDGEVYKTFSVVYGATITLEDEPTKEGYTFSGWSELPETMPAYDVVIIGKFYLYGDVNTDDEVDVVDVVDVARYVVATPSVNFREKLADLNYDNTVNIADAVVLVNHIAGNQNFVKAITPSSQSYDYDQCEFQLLSSEQNALSLCLNGEANFTAFQFEVDVPEGTDISAIHINGMRKDGHQLLYNKVSGKCYRVAALSLSNATFKGSEGELLNFTINSLHTDDVCIHDIHFITTNGTDITFDALYISGTETGCANVNMNEGNDVIYDILGRKLSKMQHGVNIVNGKKVVVK